MSIFKIQIKAGKPAVFSPSPQIVYVNDSVFWFNGDQEPHWPAPIVSGNVDKTGFLPFQIAPNSSSNQVSFAKPQTISYVCAIPNHKGESGTIIVKSSKKKGAFGKKTKKGAFAKQTNPGKSK